MNNSCTIASNILVLLKNLLYVYADDRRRTVHSLERKLGEAESLVSGISDQSFRDVPKV